MAKKAEHTNASGSQIRAGRALLGISAETLASESGVSLRTIRRIETEESATTANIEKLVETLEHLGVVFVPPNGEGAGVRLKKVAKAKQRAK